MSEAGAVGLLAHIAATLAMTGLIWFVQLVHYPLFARVGAAGFRAYEREHVRRTGRVVGPLMLLEALTAPVVILLAPAALVAAWGSIALLVVIWGVTATVQVPLHRRLETGWDADVGLRLVKTNWIRTAAWSARSALVFAVLAANLRTGCCFDVSG